MRKYSREIVSDVLAANDIVDVVGTVVELKPAGSGRLKGLCPFHHEKTSSFMVHRGRQVYHCFGCGKHGDALSFLMENDGLSFVESLRKLADGAGVQLPALRPGDDRAEYLRTRLLEFGVFASKHYRVLLQHPMRGSAGRQYLKTRQLKDETLLRFGLGYVPEGWSNLLDAAKEKGFQQDVLEASGLFKKGDRGGLYDFFRNRAIFPIKDIAGNVVAFGGRDLGDSPAKYINSPETPIYRKSRVLYGLHEARDALRHEKSAILVEGYFDLLRCFDAGIENVVATCGTALTQEQAALIRRYVPEVILVYDGDAAGVKAALRGTGVLTAAGLGVRALALPDNQDPDDFIRDEGPERFRALVAEAPDFVTFYVQMSETRVASIEGRTEVARELFGILEGIDDELRVDQYLKRMAGALSLNEWACRSEYEKHRKRAWNRQANKTKPQTETNDAPSRDDCQFLAALMNDPALLEQTRAAIEGVSLPESPLTETLEHLLAASGGSAGPELENEVARRLYAAAATFDAEETRDAGALASKRIASLKKEALGEEAAEVQRQMEEARQSHDEKRQAELFARQVRLKQKMEKAGAM